MKKIIEGSVIFADIVRFVFNNFQFIRALPVERIPRVVDALNRNLRG